MKKLLLLSLISITVFSCKKGNEQTEEAPLVKTENAQEGEFSYKPDSTSLTWTAYKTPDKMGVNGTFTEIEVTNTKTSSTKEDVLAGAEFKINSLSANTGAEDRDAKIQQLFFNNMTSPEITGHFGEFKDGIVPITLKMNDKEVTKDFDYSFSENKLTIKGSIDVLKDFEINKGFELLHNACAALHQDKTWTDVSIEITTVL